MTLRAELDRLPCCWINEKFHLITVINNRMDIKVEEIHLFRLERYPVYEA